MPLSLDCDDMLCTHSNVITHCDITMDIPSNGIIHCDQHVLVLVFMPCYNIDLMFISIFYQQI